MKGNEKKWQLELKVKKEKKHGWRKQSKARRKTENLVMLSGAEISTAGNAMS